MCTSVWSTFRYFSFSKSGFFITFIPFFKESVNEWVTWLLLFSFFLLQQQFFMDFLPSLGILLVFAYINNAKQTIQFKQVSHIKDLSNINMQRMNISFCLCFLIRRHFLLPLFFQSPPKLYAFLQPNCAQNENHCRVWRKEEVKPTNRSIYSLQLKRAGKGLHVAPFTLCLIAHIYYRLCCALSCHVEWKITGNMKLSFFISLFSVDCHAILILLAWYCLHLSQVCYPKKCQTALVCCMPK